MGRCLVKIIISNLSVNITLCIYLFNSVTKLITLKELWINDVEFTIYFVMGL